MPIHRPTELTEGKMFFQSELPIFVNRVHESFETMEHHHDFIEISCVGEGRGTHYIDEQVLSVVQGDIFFIPIGISHVFRPTSTDRDRPLVVYNCVITMSYFNELLNAFPASQSITSFFSVKDWRQFRDRHGEFYRLFQKIHHEYTSRRPYFEAALQAGLMELILYLYRSEVEQAPNDAASYSKGMDEVFHYLHTHYDQSITLQAMSALIGVGERQFHRLIKRHTGMHLTEYIQDVRIKEACRMLRSIDKKIQEIATAVGYQDIKFFNHLFKRKTGVTPRQYRKSNIVRHRLP